MVAHHFGIRCHHQLNIAGIGEKTLASAWRFGVYAGGAIVVNMSIIYRSSEGFQLLSHVPSALKHNWPLGVLCFKRKKNHDKG